MCKLLEGINCPPHRTPFNIFPQRLAVDHTACRLQNGLSGFEDKSTSSQRNKSCTLQENNMLFILLYMHYMKLNVIGCCRISTREKIVSLYICTWNSIRELGSVISEHNFLALRLSFMCSHHRSSVSSRILDLGFYFFFIH